MPEDTLGIIEIDFRDELGPGALAFAEERGVLFLFLWAEHRRRGLGRWQEDRRRGRKGSQLRNQLRGRLVDGRVLDPADLPAKALQALSVVGFDETTMAGTAFPWRARSGERERMKSPVQA